MQASSPLSSRTVLQLLSAAASCALAAASAPQAIHYGVSVTNDGFFGSGTSTGSNVSDDGRYVVFKSEANDLVPGDTNQRSDVFRHDLTTGAVEIVSLGVDGFGSWNPDVSSDGRFVVWESDSTNHVPGDTNGTWDVFLRDMELGVTERLSLTSTGAEADNQSQWARITPDARYVVFQSLAALVPTDTNGHWDVYRLDRQLNELVIVSVDAADGQGNSRSSEPDISHDGQRIAFASSADNLVPGDTNGRSDVFLKDMTTGALTRMSASASGVGGDSSSFWPCISGDGSAVGFTSSAENLVPDDTSGNTDAFAKDASTGAIERLNVRPNGNQANGYVSASMSISMDGNLVAFAAWAENLVGNDTNGAQDIFIRDRAAGTTRRINLSMTGAELDDHSFYPAMTSDARVLTYASVASNVLAGDTMGHFQIYAVDRFASGSVGESYCFAYPNSSGVGGELAATGTSVAAYNQITLSATQLPPDSFGLFIVSRMQGFIANPGGSFGNICVTQSIGRYIGPGQVQDSGAAGRIDLTIDLNAMPQPTGFVVAAPGDEWNFQLWHRDVTAVGTAGSNFTTGLSVVLR